MSHLPPSYEHPLDEEESVGLLKHDQHEQDDLQEALGMSDLAGPSSTAGNTPAVPVIYCWRPRYPIEEKDDDAMGVLGRTRLETVEMARRAFPYLQTVEEDRIEFSVKVSATPREIWARILEEAWPGLSAKAPAELRIQVRDGPGDENARFKHNCAIFGTSMLFLGVIGALIFLLVYFLSPHPSHGPSA